MSSSEHVPCHSVLMFVWSTLLAKKTCGAQAPNKNHGTKTLQGKTKQNYVHMVIFERPIVETTLQSTLILAARSRHNAIARIHNKIRDGALQHTTQQTTFYVVVVSCAGRVKR